MSDKPAKSNSRDAAKQAVNEKRTQARKAARLARYGSQFNRKSTRTQRRAHLQREVLS